MNNAIGVIPIHKRTKAQKFEVIPIHKRTVKLVPIYNPKSFSPSRGGHAPGHLRIAFLNAIWTGNTNPDSTVVVGDSTIESGDGFGRADGTSAGDLLNLTRDNLTPAGLLVKRTSKTGKRLLFEYTDELREVLAASKKLRPQVPGHYLIRNMQGRKFTTDGFSSNWQKLMKKAVKQGVERFAFKDIRAKSASDRHTDQASERLGHSSTAITKKTYFRKPPRVKPLR